MFRGEAYRQESAGRWHPLIASSDSYVTRIMCGLAVSLALVLLAVHLPFGDTSKSIGWYVSHSTERLAVEHLAAPASTAASTALPTIFDEGDKAKESAANVSEDAQTAGQGRGRSTSSRQNIHRLSGRRVLDIAQRMPEIVGGMGAYYIHIDYPEAAIREGVEGRLVLSFIVDTVGATHQVEIVESLHPACDSAAVQALRRTRFVPGLHNGERVEVKMHLPVRFQLVPQSLTEEQARLEDWSR